MSIVSKVIKVTCGYLSVQETVKYLVVYHHFPWKSRNNKNQSPANLGRG